MISAGAVLDELKRISDETDEGQTSPQPVPDATQAALGALLAQDVGSAMTDVAK